jgi:hypothetical protein
MRDTALNPKHAFYKNNKIKKNAWQLHLQYSLLGA